MTMNLNSVNGRSAYSATAAAAVSGTAKNVKAEPGHAKKLDTIEISPKARRSESSDLAKVIANEIVGLDNSKRINQIKNAVAQGTYQVSAADVASAIMGDGILI